MIREKEIKIMNLEAGVIVSHINGKREIKEEYNGVFPTSFVSEKLVEMGMKVKGNKTRDIVNLTFKCGDYNSSVEESEEYKENETLIDTIKEENSNLRKMRNACKSKIKYRKDNNIKLEEVERLEEVVISLNNQIEENNEKIKEIKTTLDNIKANATLKKDEVRNKLYNEGFTITYKDGKKIDYVRWFRSSSHSKAGKCCFINKKFYSKIRDYQRMGLVFEEGSSIPLVEVMAYEALSSSHLLDFITIPTESVLIIEDKEIRSEKPIKVNVVKIVDGECVVEKEERYIKNKIWDGQVLLDSSLFTGEYKNCSALGLREHFFKAGAFNTNIKEFMMDTFGKDYETATVKDMFGRDIKVKDILMIGTEDTIKWFKIWNYMGTTKREAMEYWLNNVIKADGCKFGICKTAHSSKLGDMQQLSYQMINSLPLNKEEVVELCETSADYLRELKQDNNKFMNYLAQTATDTNINQCLIDMVEWNEDIQYTEFFRSQKYSILHSLGKKFKGGKLYLENSDNLTIVGNPYAMLLGSVGAFEGIDETLPIVDKGYSCYTPKYNNGEELCGFRSPHNAPHNICYFINNRNLLMEKYFNFGNTVMAVNSISTDAPSRGSGFDFDTDFMYITNNKLCVTASIRALDFLTMENEIQQEKKPYNNTFDEMCEIDDKLAQSKGDIGYSSNVAQILLSHYWNCEGEDLKAEIIDDIIKLSVLCQVAIDSSKKIFEIVAKDEIEKIASKEIYKDLKKPYFWTYTENKRKDKKTGNKIGTKVSKLDKTIECPMNWVVEKMEAVSKEKYPSEHEILKLERFFVEVKGKVKYEQLDKVINIVTDYRNLEKSKGELNFKDEDVMSSYIENRKNVIEQIRKYKISDKTLNRLIQQFAFDREDNKRTTGIYVLYNYNKTQFLSMFKKMGAN